MVLRCDEIAIVAGRNMHRILGEGARDKIYKMMSFAGSGDDVADPWYMGGFDRTYSDIYRACAGLLDSLENSGI